jgi:hypothetical protein
MPLSSFVNIVFLEIPLLKIELFPIFRSGVSKKRPIFASLGLGYTIQVEHHMMKGSIQCQRSRISAHLAGAS